MVLGRGRSRRRGMVMGAAIASSRGKKQAAAAAVPVTTSTEPVTPPAAPVAFDAAQLKQLADLRDQGILTQEEFDAKKKQILGL
jgi:hypothetical protein